MAHPCIEAYKCSLLDMKCNSRPYIHMLTILAEENVEIAPAIVDTIVRHINRVPPDLKLPSLYLVDSIMKNIGGQYVDLFSRHMVWLFPHIFVKVERRSWSSLYKLRQTWNDILPKNILYDVDRTVNTIDPAWPITAMVSAPVSSAASNNPFNGNPNFLGEPSTSVQPVSKHNGTDILQMKKRQEEMCNQPKALLLEALEQKMDEEVFKENKAPVLETALVPIHVASHQHAQQNFMNHRDPRLRKLMNQPAIAVLNTRSQSNAILNGNGYVATTSTAKINDIKLNVLANNIHALEPSSNLCKSAKNAEAAPTNIFKDKHNSIIGLQSRNCMVNKKQSNSPENARKPKRMHGDILELSKNESSLLKKHRSDWHASEERFPVSVTFGVDDKDYRHKVTTEDILHSKQWTQSQPVEIHPHTARERPPAPSTTSIAIDGRNRTIYFVNDRAFTFMDNNEPKEVAFTGPPRRVYVEGMIYPIVLDFDGRGIGFWMEGKHNILRFGTPSRELYINNYPYEVKFGGPHITVFLRDQKEHKIRIDGPPPQVIISEKPAHELYAHFNRNNSLQTAKNVTKKQDDAALLKDVDMRVRPSHMQSNILPEIKKDVDWCHISSVSDPPRAPLNMPLHSCEIYNDMPGARNYTPGVLDIPSQLKCSNSSNSPAIKNNHFIPERCTNINNSIRPHQGYQEITGRPPFQQLLHVDQKSKHNPVWDQMQPPSILPPHQIIPSLTLSTQGSISFSGPPLPLYMSQMPNLSIPPPSWNPLPSPPIFTRAVADTLCMVSVGSNSNSASKPAVSQPSLPINVETIYERLVAAGLITKEAQEPKSSPEETTNNNEKMTEEASDDEDIVIPIYCGTSKDFTLFNSCVVERLYEGTQCETCGMRFKESEQLSHHLDSHFRIQKLEKLHFKYGCSRMWYLRTKDWIQYKGTEDDERILLAYGGMSKCKIEENVQSVSASEGKSEKCSVCEECFQCFWVMEQKEWHLKNAVRHEGKAYHSMCYEDHKKATGLAIRDPEMSEEDITDSIKKRAAEPMSTGDSTADDKMDVTFEKGIKQLVVEERKENDLNKEQAELKEKATFQKVSVAENNGMNRNSDATPESAHKGLHPQTPVHKFEVQPVVIKGTEISSLCCIM